MLLLYNIHKLYLKLYILIGHVVGELGSPLLPVSCVKNAPKGTNWYPANKEHTFGLSAEKGELECQKTNSKFLKTEICLRL